MTELDAEMASLRQRIDEDLARGRQAAQRERDLVVRLAFDRDVEALEAAERGVATLREVPCAGEGAYAGCQFLRDATAAAASIEELKARLSGRPALEAERAAARQAIIELDRGIEEARSRLADLSARREQAAPLAARLAKLDEASSRLEELRRARAAAVADAARAHDEAQQREHARQEQLRTDRILRDARRLEDLSEHDRHVRAQLAAHLSALETLDATIAELRREIESAEQTLSALEGAKHQADEASGQLQLLRREWDRTTATLAGVEHGRASLVERIQRYRERCLELADVDARLTAHGTDLVEWQLLQKALGRDGLQVLEIDSAGPTVAAYCNDLLQTCFGSRFSVDLVTQEAKVNKGKDGSTMKESFELKVFDALRGGEARDLSDLSGGEQVLVDEALKSAIALLVNTRNAHPIRTCWRDETTGALDEDNAGRYLQMLRRVQQLGGFHHLLFITHNPDAALQADAQIVVQDGQLRVELPPYGARDLAA